MLIINKMTKLLEQNIKENFMYGNTMFLFFYLL